MITREELTDSRQWILRHFFEEEHTREMPEFIDCGAMADFIRSVSREIRGRLRDEGYL